MSRSFSTSRQIDFAFPVMIFFAFTMSALIVILFAAQVYQHTVTDAAINYNASTSLAYIREKIHQHDNGMVETGMFDGCPALIMREELNGELYATYIYAYDGALRELFIKDENSSGFSASSGQTILDINDFKVSMEGGNLLYFECIDNKGHTANACVGIYSRKYDQ